MTFRATSYESLPPGVYPATVEDIEEGTNEYGGFRKWRFAVETSDGPRTVTAMTSGASGPKAKAFKWASTLLGRKPREEDEQLVGLSCQIHLIVNDEGFNRIEALLPAKTSGEASSMNLDRIDAQVYAEKVPF